MREGDTDTDNVSTESVGLLVVRLMLRMKTTGQVHSLDRDNTAPDTAPNNAPHTTHNNVICTAPNTAPDTAPTITPTITPTTAPTAAHNNVHCNFVSNKQALISCTRKEIRSTEYHIN